MELKTIEEGEDRPLTGDPLLNEETSFFQKHKVYIITAAVIILIILIVVLLVFLLRDSDNSNKDEHEDKKEDNYNTINLEVFSDTDNKEIFFLSEEFNLKQLNLRKLEENKNMKIDGKEYPFTKSMKLNKGNHTIELYLKESINGCKNMFKNCKDITSIYFNSSYNCDDNMESMFNGCASLVELNIDKINTSQYARNV